ncbi:DUF6950 family protein [Pontitalea aquivivens]|uniref:DUF6950 family protein n=1 Tax=Pontitalea aquivivens TaxID=3388663 RepID=UPI003970D2B5
MRYPDWRTRLQAHLATAARKPFAYGTHDCALFAFGAVQAMTGLDMARGFRGYRTLAGAMKRLRKAGLADQFALVGRHLPEIPVAYARVGDLAVVPGDAGDAFGVVQGEYIHVLQEGGLALVPLLAATRAYEVN